MSDEVWVIVKAVQRSTSVLLLFALHILSLPPPLSHQHCLEPVVEKEGEPLQDYVSLSSSPYRQSRRNHEQWYQKSLRSYGRLRKKLYHPCPCCASSPQEDTGFARMSCQTSKLYHNTVCFYHNRWLLWNWYKCFQQDQTFVEMNQHALIQTS